MGILEDEKGNLWLSTFRGLSRFNPENETFTNYTPDDGLQSWEFNSTVAFKSKDGRMFFGGANGFNAFYPDQIKDNPYLPPVVVTDFKIFNQSLSIGDESVMQKSIFESNEITLSYKELVFTLEFAALNYISPEKNRYAYKMEGFDEDWRYVGSGRRFATYTHLDPGVYKFRVKAANNDGLWNEKETVVTIVITPPWWKTRAFLGSIVLLVCAGLFGGYRWRVTALEGSRRKLAAEVTLRTQELSESNRQLEMIQGDLEQRVAKRTADLQRKDKMLEDAQRIAHLGSWDWDIITNRLEWSDEVFRIFGLSSQNFGATYENFLERIHPDDLEDVKNAVNRALSDVSFNYNIAHRIRRLDGSERIVRERGNVTFDHNTGKASHMIGTVQDITDIKKMEADAETLRAELSRLDRTSMMGVLSAGIAHEINQPLAAILSNAQAAIRFMKNDPQDIEEVKAALLDIISDDKRAGEIVRSIRNILGRDDLKHEEIDLNETVREVLALVKSDAINRGVSISENLQPDIPPVYGDRTQIQQVILNLVMNALEVIKGHHISAPEVIVSTQVEDNQEVILSVSDSGPGIEPDQLNTIFDAYETTKEGGLGIGLVICRSIADKHCGQLWAENRSEGGATFFLSLPPLVA